MPTFRHAVASVGTAIALSFMEPDASKDLPLLTQPSSDKVLSHNAQPTVVSTQERRTASPQTSQKAVKPADKQNKPATATDAPVVIPSISPRFKQLQETGLIAKNLPLPTQLSSDKAVSNNAQATVASTKERRTASPQTSQEAIKPADEQNKPATATDAPVVIPSIFLGLEQSNKGNKPATATDASVVIPSISLGLEQSLEAGLAVKEEVGKPVPSINDTRVAQSPALVSPRSPQQRQDTPTPEFLNPSANPLLFPTQTEEVQIRTTQPITLQQAIELARRNNRELEAAQITLRRTRSGLQEALAAEFPTAGINADFTRSDSAQSELSSERSSDQQLPPPFDQLSGDSDSTITTSFNTALQLNYDLLTAGRRSAAIRAAEEQIRFQQLEVERLSEQLRLNVSRTYYDLQEADAQVEISRAAVTDAAQSLRDAQLLEQAGLGTRFDVLQAQVQLANANQDLTTALSQQRIRRRQIVQLLSLAQPVDVSAADPIEVAGDWQLSLEQSIILALKNRAELEQQLAQRTISEQQRRIALSAIKPQASLSASYNILGVLNDDLAPADGFTLGARLQWNFFDGGAAQSRAQQEEANIAIAETRFAGQRDQVRLEVEQSFFDLNANAENIQTASFALEQAQESLRLARLRFQAGVGTQSDVITQQTELTRARGNRLRAILDYNRALASLQRAVSNLPDSNLFDLP